MRVAYRCVAASLAALGFFLFAITVTPSASAREVVAFDAGASPGTIIVRTSERRLYYVLSRGQAIRYPVGVGRAGQQWSGQSTVTGKYVRPDWSPPPEIARAHPNLPRIIRGGAPNNPMGEFALTLGDGTYAIHGTNRPQSVGRFVSHGCIRMYNADIRALYSMVGVGTPVIVER